uniref:Uncharacterized protein n=1 Tax=Knipowitschia caucasica TaxID=637954 RepID=A0AAV2KJE1_KNICA
MCIDSPSTSHQTVAFILINVPLVLPVCVYILWLGAQRCRSQISHSDFLTYNMVVIQLVCISGGISPDMSYNSTKAVSITGHLIRCFKLSSTTNHLIAYVVVCAPFVIPLCYIFYCGVQQLRNRAKISHTDIFTYNFVTIQLVAFFGSASQLFSMIMKRDGVKDSVSKQKAFYTIAVITGALLLKFGGEMASQNQIVLLLNSSCLNSPSGLPIMFTYTVVWPVLIFPLYILVLRTSFQRWSPSSRSTVSHTDFFTYHSIPFELFVYIGGAAFYLMVQTNVLEKDALCIFQNSLCWFQLPSSLVLPLLFL